MGQWAQVLEGVRECVKPSKLGKDIVLNSRFPEVPGQNVIIFLFQATISLRQVCFKIRCIDILEISFLG